MTKIAQLPDRLLRYVRCRDRGGRAARSAGAIPTGRRQWDTADLGARRVLIQRILASACAVLASTLILPHGTAMADADREISSAEIAPSIPTVRHWPQDREIRFGYLLIGDYAALRRHLTASEPRGLGAYWEPAFDVIAEVDVEALLRDRVASFSELTGLSITAEPILQSDPESFDMCIEVFLTDREEDLTSIPCYRTMNERLGFNFLITDAFLPWGFATTYSSQNIMQGATCFAAYSAFTFQQEIGRDWFLYSFGARDGRRIHMHAPFSRLSGHSPAGPILGNPRGFFGHIRYRTGRAEARDDAPACRQALRDTYELQMARIIDNCMTSMLGIPISNTSPETVIAQPDHSPYSSLRRLSEWPAGTYEWVSLIGYETTSEYQETPRFRLIEQHAHALVGELYSDPLRPSNTLTESVHQDMQVLIDQELERGAAPVRNNLYLAIEQDCLGPD